MKLYRHKKSNALLQEIRQTENLIVCFKLNEDKTIKRVSRFDSPFLVEAKSICRKENLEEIV